ncbi:hypothetical protein X942_4522 [Burkholderia pseudomallei MSHR5596]|nr:hypothetical protein X942_4522 [Burkholderia pseudomallei MSHR5596]
MRRHERRDRRGRRRGNAPSRRLTGHSVQAPSFLGVVDFREVAQVRSQRGFAAAVIGGRRRAHFLLVAEQRGWRAVSAHFDAFAQHADQTGAMAILGDPMQAFDPIACFQQWLHQRSPGGDGFAGRRTDVGTDSVRLSGFDHNGLGHFSGR